MEKVKKKLEDNGFDYEVKAERKTCDWWSDTLRTQEFVAEVQKIIDNEPRKSMYPIPREKGIDKKLIWLVVHEAIC